MYGNLRIAAGANCESRDVSLVLAITEARVAAPGAKRDRAGGRNATLHNGGRMWVYVNKADCLSSPNYISAKKEP